MKALNKTIMASLLLISILYFSSCDPQKKIASNYTYKTKCLGVELDGSQTLKAWGNGSDYDDAIEQAKKNAVRDVIFKGISEGTPDCNAKPLIFEVNAQEKYEDYFNKFFIDGGEYKNFVIMEDGHKAKKFGDNRKGVKKSLTYGIVVRVLRAELKNKMITDGIIK